jgi:lipid-A-disaccharide synthase
MHVAITSNGPGEFAGWVRPLVRALYALEPDTRITLFFVPDDYATGREPDVARRLFPRVQVVDAKEYMRFALGRKSGAIPDADAVQYLGGDLMHAARVRARLGGAAHTYKFARKADAHVLARAYAVDDENAARLRAVGIPAERVGVVGNLAIDGALAEASGFFPSDAPEAEIEAGGIVIMPGTRKHEVQSGVPFFLQMAVRLRERRPDFTVAFALSPFTTEAEVATALAEGGHPNAYGAKGTLVPYRGGFGIRAQSGGEPFAIVRTAMRHAPRARLVVTLPGTKCIELAALGVPTLVCVPLNAPEVVVINGPLQYLDRIPRLGPALKRAAVIAVDARFPLTAQPNIDAGEMVMPELRGTLMPAQVARDVIAYADDDEARAVAVARLRRLYAGHEGASERMARGILGRR